MKLKTKYGMEVTLEKEGEKHSPNVAVWGTFAHPEAGEKKAKLYGVCEREGKTVVQTSESFKGRTIYLLFDSNELKQVKDFTFEADKETAERKKYWMELNLGVCFNSDYSCHWWRGDERTPLEQIIEEGKGMLSCCHKPETHEESITSTYNQYFQKKKKKEEEQRLAEEKEKQRKEALKTELLIFGDELLSSVGNIALHSLAGKISKANNRISIYTTGMVSYMGKISHNTTYTIREELQKEGFVWDKDKKEWYCDYSETMEAKTYEILQKYDTRVDPMKLGLRRCWECGCWRWQSQLDDDGYCGC